MEKAKEILRLSLQMGLSQRGGIGINAVRDRVFPWNYQYGFEQG
jgi:hypothetical protein